MRGKDIFMRKKSWLHVLLEKNPISIFEIRPLKNPLNSLSSPLGSRASLYSEARSAEFSKLHQTFSKKNVRILLLILLTSSKKYQPVKIHQWKAAKEKRNTFSYIILTTYFVVYCFNYPYIIGQTNLQCFAEMIDAFFLTKKLIKKHGFSVVRS